LLIKGWFKIGGQLEGINSTLTTGKGPQIRGWYLRRQQQTWWRSLLVHICLLTWVCQPPPISWLHAQPGEPTGVVVPGQCDVNLGKSGKTDEPLLYDIWRPPDGVPHTGVAIIFLHSGAWQALEIFGCRYDPSKLRFSLSTFAGAEPASDIRDWDAIRAWAGELAGKL